MFQEYFLTNKPFEKILWFLIRALVYLWIYNGFLRLIIFKNYANYLYFMPTLILILIYILSFLLPAPFRQYQFSVSISLALVSLFQVFHIFKGDLEIEIAFYGWALYQAPFLLFIVVPFAEKMNFYNFFQKALRFSLTPNLILCFFQVTKLFPSLITSFENSKQLTSAKGYVRAFGTFTSTTGFSLYLTIVTCFMILMRTEIKKVSDNFVWAQITILYIFSGSRTVIFALIPILISFLFCIKKYPLNKLKINYLAIFPAIVISYLIINRFFPGPLMALIERFSTSRAQENTPERIVNSLFSYTGNIYDTFWGSGLGSRGIGAFNYALDSGWIENDNQRIIAEAGSIIGLIIILFRYLLVFNILFNFFKITSKIPRHFLIIFSSILPMLLYGQLFGQSSISLGTWLVLFVILIEKYKAKVNIV